MTIIVCDMGGTHVRFAYSRSGAVPESTDEASAIIAPAKYKLARFENFGNALEFYLNEVGLDPAVVRELRMALGNRNPWENLPEHACDVCPHCQYSEMNDFAANANGIAFFPNAPMHVLRAGDARHIPPFAARAVIGPGTGTGLAYILDTAHGPHVQRTHGAHIAPALLSDEHRDLFAAIHARRALSPQIIVEDILSGPGLWALYRELLERENGDTAPIYTDTRDLILRGKDDPIAKESLRIFHEIFGCFAAQVVAFGYAYSGIYLTGGITDTIMDSGRFDLSSFLKFYDLDYVPIVKHHIAATPIYWVDDPYIALKGLLFNGDKNTKF